MSAAALRRLATGLLGAVSQREPGPAGRRQRAPWLLPLAPSLATTRSASSSAGSRVAAASALVHGEVEEEAAAEKVAEKLLQSLDGRPAGCTLWFAKGYGRRAAPIGPLLKERLGSGVIVGATSEGGLIGDGKEVQEETFALAALSLAGDSINAYPFHADNLSKLPELGRGGSWADFRKGTQPLCAAAFCSAPVSGHVDPQSWIGLLDNGFSNLGSPAGGNRGPPPVIGGLSVGNHAFVDGEEHMGGGYGMVLQAGRAGARMDPVVCQGAVPFGPWLEITGVYSDHVVTGLNGRTPQLVLEPLINGPEVPGEGLTMAGIFVDPAPTSSLAAASSASLALAALEGRPSCLVRPLHHFTPEGYLVLSPLTESLPYVEGMQLQLHCFSKTHALSELRARAEHDVVVNGGRAPDAAIIISCGARGIQLHGKEGVESQVLREAWGCDVPTVGFFAGAEFGPVGLRSYMHGYTTSCLMLRCGDTP